jgi:UDP-N-acetylmuramoylalanine--D-glutamate ligase
VHLGGNVRGLANLPLLSDIEEGDFLVLELDSWQLQGFRDLAISPHIAVFTSFLDDHLNYYKGDKEAYFNDKASIFVNQKSGDILIASPQAHSEILKRGLGDGAVVPNVNVSAPALIGEHNEVSAALAHEVLISCDISPHEIQKGLDTFSGVEGRLEYIGEVRGVHVYNDNNATTPDASLAGMRAVQKKWGKNPVLILGGADKGLDLSYLEKEIESGTKEVVYLSGTGTEKISLEKKYVYEKLEDCVKKAFELAGDGDIILFSPGFASFSSYFKNEYERNDEFVRVINEVKK